METWSQQFSVLNAEKRTPTLKPVGGVSVTK